MLDLDFPLYSLSLTALFNHATPPSSELYPFASEMTDMLIMSQLARENNMSTDTMPCKNCGASIPCTKHICPMCGKYCR